MKVIYEFTDEERDQRQMFEKSHSFYSALWDISNAIRDHEKYEKGTPSETLEAISNIIADSGMWEIP